MGVLDGKQALVTGGSRGIGRAVVERLARDGARVAFGYARDEDAARAVTTAVAEAGGDAHAVRADLGTPEGVRTLLDGAAGHLDGLDLLVHVAGTTEGQVLLAEGDAEAYERSFGVNVRSAYLLLAHAAREMRDGGRIVTFSTLNTRRRGPTIALYAGGKAAVEQFTAIAATELGGRGITANTVLPGATDTDMLRDANSPEALQQVPARTPLRRLGEPADVADVVAFLCGPDGRWVTGQAISADGGLSV